MQERMDAGKDGCRKSSMHERRDAERRESRLDGYRKGGFMTEEIQNGRDATVDRRDKGQLGGRTDGIQDCRDAEKGDSGKEEGSKGGM